MSFSLLAIDIIPQCNNYGIMVFNIKPDEKESRALFTIYYSDGELFLELFFIRFQLR